MGTSKINRSMSPPSLHINAYSGPLQIATNLKACQSCINELYFSEVPQVGAWLDSVQAIWCHDPLDIWPIQDVWSHQDRRGKWLFLFSCAMFLYESNRMSICLFVSIQVMMIMNLYGSLYIGLGKVYNYFWGGYHHSLEIAPRKIAIKYIGFPIIGLIQ